MTRLYLKLILFALIFLVNCCVAETGQWIAVTAPAFRNELEPLCELRRSQGLRVKVIETTDILTREQIQTGQAIPLRDRIHALCTEQSEPGYVLLVGAVGASHPESTFKTVVPPLRATIGCMKGLPTDNGYGSLNPQIAVGRLPARNRKEAGDMIGKIILFEKEHEPGPWNHRLLIVAGSPGGSSFLEKRLADWFLQTIGQNSLRIIHPFWNANIMFHAPASPYTVSDEDLQESMIKYLTDGHMFSFYLGHSGSRGLFSNGIFFMTRTDWTSLEISHLQGVFFTCGCYGCQLEGSGKEEEGYGFTAIRNPGGPVAVIGASGKSYGAMGQLAFDGIMKCLSMPGPPARVGEYWLSIKAGLASGEISPAIYYLYDQVDGSQGRTPLATQRLTHIEKWMLLGDPATRLPLPDADITLEPVDKISPGGDIVIKGSVPARFEDARVNLTLERPLGWPVQFHGQKFAGERAISQSENPANSFILSTAEVRVKNSRFEGKIPVPSDVSFPKLVIRAYAVEKNHESMGVMTSPVEMPWDNQEE